MNAREIAFVNAMNGVARGISTSGMPASRAASTSAVGIAWWCSPTPKPMPHTWTLPALPPDAGTGRP